ncbi:Endosomal/prevacuolar sodium/hydrogen exchanger [Candida viswanathii]|uniref:Sodium/hydrogen exchanger n=1 Tax=Candida viswanathii TaxID=5486 RepID=A0A367XXL2_9ASCO|nr:Endosomal/prevacuolar sodium/hydrogen exchanger [Candida viswanathii]
MTSLVLYLGKQLIKRAIASDIEEDTPDLTTPDDDNLEDSNPVENEIFSSWALFILLLLLMSALWSSYFLQQRRIKAIHETVLSIFCGMIVGLIIRMSPGHYIQTRGYELHQANFFRNLGSILTFAIPGTFISALVVGIIIYIWTALGLDNVSLEFVDALAVGATLSATDPVTILSIFNAYKVDPKLYTIIFGESLLNDAISIVMFETCQKFHGQPVRFSSFFQGVGLFLMTFTISTIIGIFIGILVALILKHSHIRRYPQIETCLVLLFAYQSYFFSNGAHMSGINANRHKYIFQLLAQLSENFIFIYLGLSLFTEVELVFKPLLIIVAFIAICIARWSAVFPLSRFLNFLYRARYEKYSGISSNSINVPDEISHSYQMMIFWAGLRGAVGVALAMGFSGEAKWTLLATVLVVVVLTVILFGGTTASMLEILGIKIGCVDETGDSDDEFEIEAPRLSLQTNKPPNLMGNRRFARSQTKLSGYKDNVSGSAANLLDGNGSPSDNAGNSNFDEDEIVGSDVEDFMGGSAISTTTSVPTTSDRGVIGSILSAEEHVKWFTRFDEEVLKPVLLDTLPSTAQSSNNNSTSNLNAGGNGGNGGSSRRSQD